MNIEEKEKSAVENTIKEVIGAAKAVFEELGDGWSEQAYEEAMKIELSNRGIKYRSQVKIPVIYKDEQVSVGIADLIIIVEVEDKVFYFVVELKAQTSIMEEHRSQAKKYIRVLKKILDSSQGRYVYPKALVINFTKPSRKKVYEPEVERDTIEWMFVSED